MKVKLYSKAISFTSVLLNICIKNEWWRMVKKITEFRKTRLAPHMRDGLRLSN